MNCFFTDVIPGGRKPGIHVSLTWIPRLTDAGDDDSLGGLIA
jgi:hypothetical protein